MTGPLADPPFIDPQVARRFADFPAELRAGLLQLRAMIFAVAARLPEVGRIEETLKWGQPAYLTPETKAGSTLRLGVPKTGGFAIYAHCQSRIIPTFRDRFPQDFTYEGNRAVHFEPGAALPEDKLSLLIAHALRYHLRQLRAF
ncbi:DUF1801 domain-containing protein [Thioclava sp.]|uniref:DUF1801 domain-containing protein n=1 Tax=Thioclava sp. TaxID=1933450 RepID=UPI003AA80E45